MIPCTNSCIYQESGSCGLQRATSRGNGVAVNGDCAYLIQRADSQNRSPTAENISKRDKTHKRGVRRDVNPLP